MASSQQMINRPVNNGALIEKVILANDLSGLTPIEKVQHVSNICTSLGINPLTKPIQLLKFQGREIPYVTRDGCDQLRKVNHVSISKIETKILEGGLYVVTAYETTQDGRQDSSTGVINIAGKKGDDLCNAMMKAESKAKRRVTLSICGLGMPEESEADSMAGAQKVDHAALEQSHKQVEVLEVQVDDLDSEFESYKNAIEMADSLDDLKSVFMDIKKKNFKNRPELLKQLVDAKDQRKSEIELAMSQEKSQEYDAATGELTEAE